MVKKYMAPRFVLAENLAQILSKAKMTGPELAAKAKVDRKTVNNMLNARCDPRPEMIDAVAGVLGLTGWQLLRPGTGNSYVDAGDTQQLEHLIESYQLASPEQRATIVRVADLATHAPKPNR